jgi:uncharacterized Rossmann fold enzyme
MQLRQQRTNAGHHMLRLDGIVRWEGRVLQSRTRRVREMASACVVAARPELQIDHSRTVNSGLFVIEASTAVSMVLVAAHRRRGFGRDVG